MRASLPFAAALLFLASGISSAQRDKEPRRPKLAAGADTNDAHAYYDFAVDLLARDPDKAADALYWSSRIEPMWADAYYARRIALILANPRMTVKEAKPIDSLLFRALGLNPFLSTRLDRFLIPVQVRLLSGTPVAVRAWFAYNEGLYDEALDLYAKAIKTEKKKTWLYVARARLLFGINRPDSALADLNAAVEEIRREENKDLVVVYQSRAVIEHSLAVVHERLGNAAAAKEAYGRALQEDLSYYPAHLQLSFLALEAHDTTTALSELDLATQLREDDAGAQYLSGFTLVMAGRATDAEPHLKKAIQLDPWYAAPKFIYARLLEAAEFKEEAIA
ncbi:MAG: hypothetical protein ACREBE_01625, partial [bacterium]